jgi:hypothetical protein
MIQQRNAKWFNRHKPPDQRLRYVYKEVFDTLDWLTNEATVIYQDFPAEDRVKRMMAMRLLRDLNHDRIQFAQSERLNELWMKQEVERIVKEYEQLGVREKVREIANTPRVDAASR